jgi:hypothetical protein
VTPRERVTWLSRDIASTGVGVVPLECHSCWGKTEPPLAGRAGVASVLSEGLLCLVSAGQCFAVFGFVAVCAGVLTRSVSWQCAWFAESWVVDLSFDSCPCCIYEMHIFYSGIWEFHLLLYYKLHIF